jgi:MFS family permease
LQRYRQLLSRRESSALLWAGLISEIGDWFNTVALLVLAHAAGGSFGVGLVLALRMVPRLVFQAPAGALVDRWPATRTLVWSHVLMGVIAAAFVLVELTPQIWLICLLIVALETVNTVAWPAYRVQLVNSAPADQFAAVNGLLSTGLTAAQFIGPVLGGLVLASLGAIPVFLVNGLTFVGVAIAFSWSQSHRHEVAEAHPPAPGAQSLAGEVPSTPAAGAAAPGGYGWLLRQTDLALFALAALGATIAIRGGISLFVDRADSLGLGDAGPGYFYAAVGFGAVIGGIGAGAGSHRGIAALQGTAAAMAACAASLAIFGGVGSVPVALATLAIAGFATNVYEVLGLTYFQHRLPADRYGRFLSIFLLALGIGGIIGALSAPILESWLSVGMAVGLLALPGVLFALVLLIRSLAWNRAGTP